MTSVITTPFTSAVFGDWLADRHWKPQTLTFSFPADGSLYSYQDAGGYGTFSELGSQQKATVRQVFQDIADFTGLTFEEVTETPGTEATLRAARESGLSGGYAYVPAALEEGGDAFFGMGSTGPKIGNEAHLLFYHELGHAMGLLHGHESPSFAASGFDSQEYTLMTYTDYVGDTDTSWYDSGPVDWAQSYMQLDIAALQYLYGANYSETGEIWSGDTTYRFNPQTGEMSINGAGLGTPAGNRIFRTIWDGHGTDTYDLSNYSTDLEIRLAAGAWSTFSDAQLADLNRYSSDSKYLARGNLANARLVEGDTRGLIENAVGGTGDDLITGNRVGNKLIGSGGDDTLKGFAGPDILRGVFGRDLLFGGKGNDTLRGEAGKDVLNGEAGRDRLFGGSGDDVLRGGAQIDTLDGGGADDVLKGGSGGDILIGGTGTDLLFGQGGPDVFKFRSVAESPRDGTVDRIEDFVPGQDKISLAAMTGPAMDLAIGGGFSGGDASAKTREVNGNTQLRVDIDGDRSADFRVLVVGATGLTADDFLL